MSLDFEGLAEYLLHKINQFLPSWLPGGKIIGREYCCGGIRGGPGDSFKVNTQTGRWAEFAGDLKGGDMISLFAAIHGLDQGEAAQRLAVQFSYKLRPDAPLAPLSEPEVVPPPPIAPVAVPAMVHSAFGPASSFWCYRDEAGRPMFYVARYETKEGKQFFPWTWNGERWVMKGFPAPRPLYGLDLLKKAPGKAVMVVEGEKAADAARKLVGSTYVVVTWPNGAKAADKTDWAPIYGRPVILWPDADEPGRNAMRRVSDLLKGFCEKIKIINVDDQQDGWDAADAYEEAWDMRRLVEWAKPRAVTIGVTVNAPAEPEDPKPASAQAIWDQLGIQTTQQGNPITNIDNCMRILNGWPAFQDLVWYDEFHQRYFTKWNTETVREWADIDTLNLTVILQREFGFLRIEDSTVGKSVLAMANQRVRNEPRDWMDSLAWDGVERISTFFIDAMGVEPGAYTHAVSHNFWISMVARIFRPGCQVDNMVILEGKEGIFKSKSLEAIGERWYMNAHEQVTSKDFFMSLQGKLIVELSELDSFSKAEGTRIKQVITCRTDRYRAPYGRASQDNPRMSIFVGSTNERHYLRDNTGARRFWPLTVKRIDLDLIKRDREQLFAEAVSKFKSGENWYEMPGSETASVQEDRRQFDEWENGVSEFLMGKNSVMLADVANHLGVERGRLDVQTQRRIGGLIRRLGWERLRVRRDAFTLAWVWVPAQPEGQPLSDSQLPLEPSTPSVPSSNGVASADSPQDAELLPQ